MKKTTLKRRNSDPHPSRKRSKIHLTAEETLKSIAWRLAHMDTNSKDLVKRSETIYQEIYRINCETHQLRLAQIEYWMGRNLLEHKLLDKAIDKFESSISILHTANSIVGLGIAYEWLANCQSDQYDYESALENTSKAIYFCRQTEFIHKYSEVVLLRNNAIFCQKLNKIEEAIKFSKEAVSVGESLACMDFIKDQQTMHDFTRALAHADPERYHRIVEIMNDPCPYFTNIDTMFVNWSILTEVHHVILDFQHPGIRKTLKYISDSQKVIIHQADLNHIFQETTLNEIHSFLFEM